MALESTVGLELIIHTVHFSLGLVMSAKILSALLLYLTLRRPDQAILLFQKTSIRNYATCPAAISLQQV